MPCSEPPTAGHSLEIHSKHKFQSRYEVGLPPLSGFWGGPWGWSRLFSRRFTWVLGLGLVGLDVCGF